MRRSGSGTGAAAIGRVPAVLCAAALSVWASGTLVGAGEVHRTEALGPASAGRGSIYELGVTLVDEAGARVGLDLFRGHPVLISMFYASCPDACPLLIGHIRRIESRLPAAARSALRVLLITLDPEHVTPDVLRQLARRHAVDTARWRFLTGDEDAVREVAAALGIRFRRLPRGVINHSSVITLLDGAGAADTRIEGLGQPSGRLVERVTSLARRRP